MFGFSQARYLNDLDGNGLELYRDRPQSEWRLNDDGNPILVNKPLDVAALIDEGRA